jgi:Saccharopine dehydrogenase NADP binding domain
LPAPRTVGIVGAYGQVGRQVAADLAGVPGLRLRLGGRNGARLAELGGVGETRVVDALDEGALARFCAGCDLVVNASGPAHVVRDRVALAALAAGAHYVDPGGDVALHKLIGALDPSLRRHGLGFVLSAGWVTGMTGVLPTFAVDTAEDHLDRIESVELLYGDCSDWSTAGFEDVLDHVLHHSDFGWYEHGRWIPGGGLRLLRRPRRQRLPGDFGKAQTIPHFERELTRIGAVRAYPRVVAWVAPLIGNWDTLRLMVLGRRSPERAARLLGELMERERAKRECHGFVKVNVDGERDGGPAQVRAVALMARGQEWIPGAVCATAVRHVLDAPRPGLAYLADAVDARAFVADLAERGLDVECLVNGRPRAIAAPPADLATAGVMAAAS